MSMNMKKILLGWDGGQTIWLLTIEEKNEIDEKCTFG